MKRASARGMTILEVMVALTILAMMALLIFGAFDSMNKGRKGESMRAERARQGRGAVLRIGRELQTAFISLHNPTNQALITRQTAFYAQHSQFDRVDFTAFAHRRFEADKKESDQCELGFFVVKDPDSDRMDLVRREQTPVDTDVRRGGVVNVLAEDVEEFRLRYLDPATGLWTDSWDSLQLTGQAGRIPLEVHITLVLKGVGKGPSYTYSTKVMLPIQQPLRFGLPQP